MQEQKIKKQFSNMVVVEKIEDKLVRYQMSRLRKQCNLNTNNKFKLMTSCEVLNAESKFDFELFDEDFKHPFEINEVNSIDRMVAIYYVINNKVLGMIYLFEINEDK